MYGGEHGYLLHTMMVLGSWIAFFVICLAPVALLVFAWWLIVKRRKLHRGDNTEN